MLSQKGDDLAANLQLGHIGVQQQPVGTVDFQYDVAVEHVVDVRRRRGHT